ncbi:MAG: PAQR family membrane homeostasis protein TrhA [Chitinophagales bacterium]
MTTKSLYTTQEERFNYWSHGLAALVSVGASFWLIKSGIAANNYWVLFSVVVFSFTLMFTFLTSTLYHLAEKPKLKDRFRLIDHLAIYLMIAGSYTPFTLVSLRDNWGITAFILIWSLTIFAMIFKLAIRKNLSKYYRIDAAIYVALGCIAVFFMKPIVQTLETPCFALLLLGGLSYLVGVIFYLWNKLPYNHGIWHIFVILGAGLHYSSILFYVVPSPS